MEKYFNTYFLDENITHLFNDITGDSLPKSVLKFPHWFRQFNELEEKRFVGDPKNDQVGTNVLPSTIPHLSLIRYQYFWKVLIDGDEKLYLKCGNLNCSTFDIAVEPKLKNILKHLLKDESQKHRARKG